LLTVSRSFMNVANSVLWRMVIILKANKVNLFVSSVLFVFWYHSLNFLGTPCITRIPIRFHYDFGCSQVSQLWCNKITLCRQHLAMNISFVSSLGL
jgi:hypothetical protein